MCFHLQSNGILKNAFKFRNAFKFKIAFIWVNYIIESDNLYIQYLAEKWLHIFHSSDRITLHKLRVEQQRIEMNLIDLAGECIESALSQFGSILSDGGEGWLGILAQRKVIDSYDADIPGNGKPLFLAGDHSGMCQKVMPADDRSTSLSQKSRQMTFDTLAGQKGMSCLCLTVFQFVFTKCTEEGEVTFLKDVGTEATAQVADLFMPQRF